MKSFRGLIYGSIFSLAIWVFIFLLASCGDEITQVTVEQNPPPKPPVIRCEPDSTTYYPVPTLPPEEQEEKIDGMQTNSDHSEC